MKDLLRLSIGVALTLALASPAPAGFLDDAQKAIGGAVQQGQQALGGAIEQGQQAFGGIQQGAQQFGQQIGQTLKPLSQSDFRFDFKVDCTASDAKAKPGESVTITFNCRGGRGTVTVTVLGQTGSAGFDTPLGRTSVPITGIQNVATLNVDIAGTLEGAAASAGDASVTPSRLTWSIYGPQTVTVKIPSTATPGTRYTVTVQPKYTATIGGSISALGTTQSIASFTAPVAQASPARATVEVVAPSFLPGFEAWLAIAALGITAVALQRRRE